MTRYRVLAWRGIPMQVKARGDGQTVSAHLDGWFTEHVDRVAMATGLYGTDAYLEQFAWSPWTDREGTAADVAHAVAAELEAEWAPVRAEWVKTGSLGA